MSTTAVVDVSQILTPVFRAKIAQRVDEIIDKTLKDVESEMRKAILENLPLLKMTTERTVQGELKIKVII